MLQFIGGKGEDGYPATQIILNRSTLVTPLLLASIDLIYTPGERRKTKLEDPITGRGTKRPQGINM